MEDLKKYLSVHSRKTHCPELSGEIHADVGQDGLRGQDGLGGEAEMNCGSTGPAGKRSREPLN